MKSENIPKNEEVLETLSTIQDTLEDTKKSKAIDREGKKIIGKTEEVISDVAELVKKKNPNDTIQKIVKESQKLYDDMLGSDKKWADIKKTFKSEVDSEEFREKLINLRDNIKILAVELVRSSDFRQDMADLFSLFYNFLLEQGKEQIEKQEMKSKGKEQKMGKEKPAKGPTAVLDEIAHEQARTSTTTSTGMGPAPTMVGHPEMHREQAPMSQWDRNWNPSKDQLFEKFNEVMKNINTRKRGYEIFSMMRELLAMFKRPAKKATEKAKEEKYDIQTNPHFKKIVDLTQELFKSITNYDPEKMVSMMKKMYYSVTEDKQISRFLKDFTNFMDEQLKNPDQIGSEKSVKRLEEFYERGRNITKNKDDMRKYAEKFKHEFYNMLEKISKDDIFTELQSDIKDMVALLVLDKSGNFTFKPEVFQQLKNIFFIALIEKFKLPLPGIRYRGESINFRMKAIMLNLQEVLPDKIAVEHSGKAVIDLSEVDTKKGKMPEVGAARETVSFRMTNINVKIPAAEIEFSRDKFPKIDDSGFVDITVGGRGMDINVSVYIDMNMRENRFFELARINCDLHDLKITLKETCHDTLYNTLIKMFNSSLKENIENSVEETIRMLLVRLNRQILTQKEFLQGKIKEGVEMATTGLKKTPEWKEKTF